MRQLPAPLPSIRCHLCKRTVDRIECERPFDKHVTRITVYCHGDKESIDFPMRLILQIRSTQDATFGESFVTARILPPVAKLERSNV